MQISRKVHKINGKRLLKVIEWQAAYINIWQNDNLFMYMGYCYKEISFCGL